MKFDYYEGWGARCRRPCETSSRAVDCWCHITCTHACIVKDAFFPDLKSSLLTFFLFSEIQATTASWILINWMNCLTGIFLRQIIIIIIIGRTPCGSSIEIIIIIEIAWSYNFIGDIIDLYKIFILVAIAGASLMRVCCTHVSKSMGAERQLSLKLNMKRKKREWKLPAPPDFVHPQRAAHSLSSQLPHKLNVIIKNQNLLMIQTVAPSSLSDQQWNRKVAMEWTYPRRDLCSSFSCWSW